VRETLREEFDHALTRYADRVAIEDGVRQLTFAQVDAWANAVAGQLSGLGVRSGDVVAVYLRNCAEFLVTVVAISRLGAIKMPVNYMLPETTVADMLDRSGAQVFVVSTSLAEIASAALKRVPDVSVVQVTDDGGPGLSEATPLTSLPDSPPAPVDYGEFALTSRDLAALYFTGGTTGRPKGVLHTQVSSVTLHYAQMLEAELVENDRLLLMTPLAHAAGSFAESALIRGATIVVRDGFDADEVLELLETERITWTFLVPTMIYRLLDAARAGRERSLHLRTVVYGAAPISPNRLVEALEVFGQVFVQLYGQTESPNWGTRLPKSDHDPGRLELLGSCGQASIMADVMVVDDDGTPQPPRQTGEICLRTPYLLHGYLDDLKATRKKFLGGWVRTGDIGFLDEDGYLYLRDRKNDMVISGGMNVYCREVEDVLSGHPSVRTVAVIGIPHDDWGEAVHAVVVPASTDFSSEELLDWARGRLANYARPKSVEVAESLPETAFGKIDKQALRGPYWRDRDRGIG
jgi:fatty-acyl-CoA synthase/long-chain acyl-CoA synthetase